jgi:hypothetical protein
MADDPAAEAKRRAEEAKKRSDEALARSHRDYAERSKGKPTPTQAENDRAALGEHVMQKEPDGSPEEAGTAPDVYGHSPEQRQLEARRAGERGQYQTRAQPRPE